MCFELLLFRGTARPCLIRCLSLSCDSGTNSNLSKIELDFLSCALSLHGGNLSGNLSPSQPLTIESMRYESVIVAILSPTCGWVVTG